MSSAEHTSRVRTHISDHAILRVYFASVEADAGLRSIHGSLVDMALSGLPTGGTMSHERSVTDWKHGGDSASSQHRRVRNALTKLTPLHRNALWLAHGPMQWPAEVTQAYGERPGPCLLTESAMRGWVSAVEQRRAAIPAEASYPGLQSTKLAEARERARLTESRGVGEWLRTLALGAVGEGRNGATVGSRSTGDNAERRKALRRRVQDIREEAAALVREAQAAFDEAYGRVRQERRSRKSGDEFWPGMHEGPGA